MTGVSKGDRHGKSSAIVRLLVLANVFGCFLCISGSFAADFDTPIISRAAFHSETDKDNPGISPNGAFVSFTASPRGKAELWVASASSPRAARRVATIEDGTLSDYYWSADSSKLLCLVDVSDGQHRLDSIKIKSGRRTNLLDTRSRVSFLGVSSAKPNIVAIGFPRADSKGQDVYALDINSGKKTPVLHKRAD